MTLLKQALILNCALPDLHSIHFEGEFLMKPIRSRCETHLLCMSASATPSLIVQEKQMHWPDEQATAQAAQALATVTDLGQAYIELHGSLGAGKTTFVRHLLQALGVQGHIKSPTYTVVESYQGTAQDASFPIWHFDFYRFNDPLEWEDAGFRDIFATSGLKLTEWAEQAAGLLPPADLVLRITANPQQTQRDVSIQASTALGHTLLVRWLAAL